MNFLDRAIEYVSPKAGLRRQVARAQTDVIRRGYSATRPSRANGGWVRAGTSADAEIGAAADKLRAIQRDLNRNNPTAAKAVTAWVNNLVGPGIVPRANTGDAEQDKVVNDLWDEFSKVADADAGSDVYGLQALAAREMVEGGDALIRRRPRKARDGLPVAMQLEVLTADYFDSSVTQSPAGREVMQGIELDALNRRVAYWLYNKHPGDAYRIGRNDLKSRAVAAQEVTHLYWREAKQLRGVPWGVSAMEHLRDLADYEHAELIRKKLEACAVGVVSDLEEGAGANGEPIVGTSAIVDGTGQMVDRFEPGMFVHARGGRSVTFNQPHAVGGYYEYKRAMLRTIAAGYRLPYEILSGDLENVNYSSIRAGFLEFRRLVESLQWQVLIPLMCEPMWRWFCDVAYLEGKINSPNVPVIWTPPRFESIDPLKDVTADVMEVRAGLTSMTDAIAKRGYNADDVLASIKSWNDKIDAAEIILDTDPRRVTHTGAMQAALTLATKD